ncbi:MAG TPA: hypothetical protein VHH55_04330, partial [Gaiellaceae bacterium]|nr:hypothetical protein [Gaiellaceae bacterium]
RGRRAPAHPPGLVDELTDALVTRPGKPESLCFGPDAPAGLGDRHVSAIEANERLQKARRDPRSDHRHALQCGR